MIRALLILGVLSGASPALAGHANPWAEPEDELLMQYHDDNLEQSVDTPGEDEMLGVMIQSARGQLEDMAADGADAPAARSGARD